MKIKNGFVIEEVGGSYLAVAVGDSAESFNGMVRLNGTGAFFWNLMKDKDITCDELVDEVLKVYEGVTREQVTADALAFVAKLRDAGILE